MREPDPRIGRAQELLDRFRGDDPGRSAALSFCAVRRGRYRKAILSTGSDVRRPVASVAKVALVMALYDLAAAGLVSLDEQIDLGALGETRYVSIMRAFDKGRRLSLRELAAIALITSDNPVAVYLQERVGLPAVNRVLHRAGIATDARLTAGFREHELGPANRVNALSAREVLCLFHLLASDRRYGEVILALENNLRNNRIPARLPDEAVIAHKTGSLAGVGNDAGIVRFGPEAFTVGVLCDGQADPAVTSDDIAVCSEGLWALLVCERETVA